MDISQLTRIALDLQMDCSESIDINKTSGWHEIHDNIDISLTQKPLRNSNL